MMTYKGYLGQVVYDDDAKIFHGDVVGIKDVIIFQGTTVKALEKAFRDSVDCYIDWCKERGEQPEKPFSGSLRIRVAPELHARLAKEAVLQHKSLNSFVIDKLTKV